MAVKLHQDVAGLRAGQQYTGELEHWLVAEGYASDGKPTDKSKMTSVLVADDPRLAVNREPAGEDYKDQADPAQLEVSQPRPVNRNVAPGAPEDAETQAVTDELHAGADVKVTDAEPAVQKGARKAAEKAAGTGSHDPQPR